ncbi:MAG: hypothetical protein WA655_09080 [Candidatus Korobacteraceae bacterium]
MKALRYFVLMMAVGVVPVFLTPAYGQFEISPDHFDQPPAKVAASSKAHNKHNGAASHHHSNQSKMATKRAGGRAHHRVGRTSA